MIRNTAEWNREEAPDSVQTLLSEVEESDGTTAELSERTAYAQCLFSRESSVQQIHLGYYLPEMATDFDPDEPFKQEFFIYSSSNDNESHIKMLYASEPIELFDDSDEYEQKLVEVDEALMEELSYELSDDGLFEYTSAEDLLA